MKGQYILTACAIIALILCLASPSTAKLETSSWEHQVQIVSPSDWAQILDDVTTADTTTMTYTGLSGSTNSVAITQASWVGVTVTFAGSSDTCTIRPAFFDSTSTFIRMGDARSFTASTLTDTNGLYLPTEGTEAWESWGNGKVIPVVTAVSSSALDVWVGTR